MSGQGAGPRVAAVLLAAGSSRRFGAANKLLAEFDGVPLVVRAARILRESAITQLVVVTGHEAEQISGALRGIECTPVYNARHAEGIGTSVATGILELSVEIDGALIVQGDMPNLSTALVDRLIARFAESGGDRVIVPVDRDGLQGNPVLWPRRLFAELGSLAGDRGAKALLARSHAAIERVRVDEADAFLDIDTEAELAEARRQRRGG